jgi:ABC-2 type transport system ATP-binding protein
LKDSMPGALGMTTTIRCLLGMERASAGRAEIFGVDGQAHPAEAHRRAGYVPGEANLWPGLTGGEALHLLGRIQGKVDEGCRDELTGRFRLDPSRRVRAYSKGNRQKVLLVGLSPGQPALANLRSPASPVCQGYRR